MGFDVETDLLNIGFSKISFYQGREVYLRIDDGLGVVFDHIDETCSFFIDNNDGTSDKEVMPSLNRQDVYIVMRKMDEIERGSTNGL